MHTNSGDTERGSEAVTNNDPHFRNLVDNALTGILDNTLEGKILFVNQALASMLEFESPEQMQAEGILLRWCDPEDRKAFIASLKQQGYVNNYEVDVFSRTGRHMHVLLSSRLQGDVISSMVVDITERKKTEIALQEYQQRLRALASELTLTEERERRNIALELHDQVGQSLAVMRMQLAVARKESNGRKVAAILDEVSGSLRAAIHDTRNIISDLSSPVINELGLAAALSEWLKERIGEYYGLESGFIDDGEPKPLDKDTEAILFRSARELLTNVIKHANANRVSVSIQRRDNTVQIVVEDDGAGMADGRQPEKDNAEGGFGLFSIRERMSDLSGSLEIESHPGRGVRAILTAPLESGD